MRTTYIGVLTVLAGLGLFPSPAAAQPYEAVGLRALGMGGAFVAVADDASAVYWNPAGLATGRFFSVVFDTSGVEADATTADPAALRLRTTLAAIGTPPLGLSYYRVAATAARAGGGDADTGTAAVARLRTSHVGVTLVQTLVDGLHLGGTLKYVRGDAASGTMSGDADTAVGSADMLAEAGAGAFDVDLGLMADFGRARAGLAMRNALAPEFRTPAGETLRLERQVRAGVAILPSETLVVSADVDLREVADLVGPARMVAVGAEQRLLRDRLGLRAGVRGSTSGPSRATVTGGASVALRTGVYADGYVAAGVGRLAATGAGVGFRVIF